MTNRTLGWTHLLLALALLAVALPAEAWDLCAHGAERRATVDTTGATSVVIEARAGDLAVRPSTAATLSAHGQACASSAESLQQTNLSLRREGDVVRVKVLVPEPAVSVGLFYATLDLTVEVPGGLPVEISDSSGDIVTNDVRVSKVTDSSGDMVLRNLPADVEIWDSSGDVRVEDSKGRVQVRDSSGDIEIAGAAEVLIPVDSSGDILVQHVTGNVRIEQDSSGDVRVSDVGRDFALLADSSGEVKVANVRGRVSVPR